MLKKNTPLALVPKALVAMILIAYGAAHAQAGAAGYPTKPVKLVVGFAAGGPTDVVARAFADHASKALGQPFIIDNKPGANTILAAQAVAKSWVACGRSRTTCSAPRCKAHPACWPPSPANSCVVPK